MRLREKLETLNLDRSFVICILIMIVGFFAVFGQTLTFGFLNWDDSGNIYKNLWLTSGNWTNFWNHIYYGLYIPVSYSVWAVVYWIGNGDPLAFRIFNLFLHGANTGLVCFLLSRFSHRAGRTNLAPILIGVFVFAIHPVQVETVAWVTGGRDLLSVFFSLLTLICITDSRAGSRYAGFLFFVLAILSKPAAASLPLIVLILDLIGRRNFKRSLICFVGWCLPVAILFYINSTEQSAVIQTSRSTLSNVLVSFDTYCFYITKLIYPCNLAVDYGRTPDRVLSEDLALVFSVLALAVLMGLLSIFSFRRRKLQLLWSAILWFVAILPVSGIVSFAFQEFSTVADRYNYGAMIWVSTFLMFLVYELEQSFKRTTFIICSIFLAIWSFQSFGRVKVWRDNKSFYTDMLEKNPDSFSANMGLAREMSEHKNSDAALQKYQAALKLRSGDIGAIDGIVGSLVELKQFGPALEFEQKIMTAQLDTFLRFSPSISGSLLNNFGLSHYGLGHLEKASLYFCFAHRTDPSRPTYKENSELQIGTASAGPQICPLQLDFKTFSDLIKSSR